MKNGIKNYSKITDEQKRIWNNIRSSKLTMLSKKNIELIKQIKDFNSNVNVKKEIKKGLVTLSENLSKCSSFTLYEISNENNKLIGSHRCKHRHCNICNWANQKGLRRKYMKYFKENEYLYHLQDDRCRNYYLIKSKYDKAVKNNVLKNKHLIGKVKYNLMFLTLTLPHTREFGFNGDKFYYKKIKELFTNLRQQPFFQSSIYGGIFSFETTTNKKIYTLQKGNKTLTMSEFDYTKQKRNGILIGFKVIKVIDDKKSGSGLHIHVHSLILVRKQLGNRDLLHKEILKHWNDVTVNKQSISTMSDFRIEKIRKGNKLIDFDFCKKLKPKGATQISLENIYTYVDGKKVYPKDWGGEAMIKAVLEAVKYQFEPQAFDKKYNEYDIDLLGLILHHTKNFRSTGKWGVLYGASELNLRNTADNIFEEFNEANEMKDEDNKKSGLSEYYSVHPSKVFHDVGNDFAIKITKRRLQQSIKFNGFNSAQALDMMYNFITQKKQ